MTEIILSLVVAKTILDYFWELYKTFSPEVKRLKELKEVERVEQLKQLIREEIIKYNNQPK